MHPLPIYFMTEDNVGRVSHQINLVSGQPYGAVPEPSNIESVITPLPTGSAGAPQLRKLNHYYEPGDLTDVFLLPLAFRRPKRRRRGYYADPSQTCQPPSLRDAQPQL